MLFICIAMCLPCSISFEFSVCSLRHLGDAISLVAFISLSRLKFCATADAKGARTPMYQHVTFVGFCIRLGDFYYFSAGIKKLKILFPIGDSFI